MCTFSMTNVEFGTIDITATTPYNTTGSFTYSCTGDPGQIVRICPSFGLNGTPRTMTDPAGEKLAYDLYSDPDHRVVWGTWFGNNPRSPIIDVPLNGSGTGVGSRIVYAQIAPGQTATPATYQQGFGSDQTSIGYAYANGGGSCSSIAHVHYRRVPFTASAIVK